MSKSDVEREYQKALKKEIDKTVSKMTATLYYGVCPKCGTDIERYDSRVTCPFCGAIVDLPFTRNPG